MMLVCGLKAVLSGLQSMVIGVNKYNLTHPLYILNSVTDNYYLCWVKESLFILYT